MTPMHSEKYTLPIVVPLRVREEWRVYMNQASDPEFSFARENQAGFPSFTFRTEDAFDVRADFLSIRSPEDALRFLGKYGPFQYQPDEASGTKKGKAAQPEPVKWSLIQQARKDFEEALLADGIPTEKAWLYNLVFGQPLILELPFRAVTPELSRLNWKDDAAIAYCHDVVDALRTSIFLSRMRGFKWKRCARQGCNQLFEQDTKHQKIYCTPECAHLQAVNNYNARQKKRARKPNNQKPTKGR
jgi:hypothetical protein